jgi:hypothetical protein
LTGSAISFSHRGVPSGARICNRKLRNIHPSWAFWPEVTSVLPVEKSAGKYNQHFVLLLRKEHGKKLGMRRTYFWSRPSRDWRNFRSKGPVSYGYRTRNEYPRPYVRFVVRIRWYSPLWRSGPNEVGKMELIMVIPKCVVCITLDIYVFITITGSIHREHPQPTFCTTTKKKARKKTGHAQNILLDRASSGSTTTNVVLSVPIYYW